MSRGGLMKKKQHSTDVLFMFILFAMFAILSVLIIYIGQGVYDRISENKESNSQTRTTISYVMNKVRETGINGNVEIVINNGIDMLALKDDTSDVKGVTYIYEYAGKLMEMKLLEGDKQKPEFGDVLLEVDDITFRIDEQSELLTVTVTDKNRKKTSVSCYLLNNGE